MTLRPIPARWFELVTINKDLASVLECLAQTGDVELEARSGGTERLWLPDVHEHLRIYHELARRYHSYWPAPVSPGPRSNHSIEALNSARQRLVDWQTEADPIIGAIEAAARQIEELEQLIEALRLLGAELPDLKLLAGAGPRLQARLLALPDGARLREIPPLVLFRRWETPAATYILIVGRQSDIRDLEAQLAGIKGRALRFPAWLAPSAAETIAAAADRLARLTGERAALQARLADLSTRQQIAAALGEMALVEWLSQHAAQLRGGKRLAWVTGWTSDLHGTAVHRALDAAGLRYIIKLSDASVGTEAPLLLSNPPWARMFEAFSRMLGMPGRNDSDPSIVLAVIAPVLFGFMFGDVGQGLVICLAGIALGGRIPLVRILISGGMMAIFFGVLFGSVFSRDDIIPALWIRPLADPITILAAAVALGVVVLSIGMLLDAAQTYWRGDAKRWWGYRAGLTTAYFGLIAAPLRAEGLAVAALGALWFLIGAALLDDKPGLGAMARAGAELVEQTLRLIVNTISFARVGAFALAHAGLSAAIISLAEASGGVGYWIVLGLGNLLVIALEGMIVSIQTTRLMLFEFFIRFLAAGGREFKPLPPPKIATLTSSSQA
jgi:V/A-type H+-transporting ATPase subunit I